MYHETLQYVLQQLGWMGSVTKELLLAMGIGVQWVLMTLRIFVFGALVAPFFVPSILWYIVSPTVIRRVSYRTSPTTRVKNLKTLVHQAKRGVVQPARNITKHLKRKTAHDDHTGSHPTCFSWRWFFSKFHGVRSSSDIDMVREDLDGEVKEENAPGDTTPRSLRVPLCVDAAQSATALGAPTQEDAETSSTSTSDSDEEEVVDEEDAKNLHNRATLDIYLPCPVDELLRVQRSVGRQYDVSGGSPRRSGNDDSGVKRTLSSLFEASPPPSPLTCKKRPTARSAEADADSSSRISVKKYPIAILVPGGAWIIGSHFWSALLARHLASEGFLVFCPDYRNFPQSNMAEMTRDVSDAIGWVLRNADRYHGDLERVTLVGQSAGAHLCWMSIISQAQVVAAAKQRKKSKQQGMETSAARGTSAAGACSADSMSYVVVDDDSPTPVLCSTPLMPNRPSETGDGTSQPPSTSFVPPPSETMWSKFIKSNPSEASALQQTNTPPHHGASAGGVVQDIYHVFRYDPKSIHHFVSLSGIYDLPHLIRHFHQRGLYRKVLYKIAGGKARLRSEFCVNRYFEEAAAVAATNRMHKGLHISVNTADRSGTVESAEAVADLLAGKLKRVIERVESAQQNSSEESWSLQRLLLNDSFLDATFTTHAIANHRPPQLVASVEEAAPATSFLFHLPCRVTLMHGDKDCSAPFSEASKLFHRIQEARNAVAASCDASSRFSDPLELQMVAIVNGTHTNVIVEELLCGKGCVVKWLLQQQTHNGIVYPSASKQEDEDAHTFAMRTPHKGDSVPPPSLSTCNVSSIRMAVPSRRQSLLLRMASYVCPF